MNKLKIAYFGTPNFSASLLEKLISDKKIPIEIVLIVTQPDKPVGKKQIMTPSPVKVVGQKYSIPVFDRLTDECVNNIRNCDFALVFAYGFKSLIPQEILGCTKIKFGNTSSGFINIHPSLLPKYRGASPIAYPLILGDTETGVSLFIMDERMDHGPIIVQDKIDINPTEKRPDLEKKLTELSFQMFKKLINSLDINVSGGLINNKLIKQDDDKATYARYFTKDGGFIPFSVVKKALNNKELATDELPKIIQEYSARNNQLAITNNQSISNFKSQILNSPKIIFNLFRGLFPWPGIWTKIQINHQEKRLRITDVEYINSNLVIKKLQLEGKKEVDLITFQKAYLIF